MLNYSSVTDSSWNGLSYNSNPAESLNIETGGETALVGLHDQGVSNRSTRSGYGVKSYVMRKLANHFHTVWYPGYKHVAF